VRRVQLVELLFNRLDDEVALVCVVHVRGGPQAFVEFPREPHGLRVSLCCHGYKIPELEIPEVPQLTPGTPDYDIYLSEDAIDRRAALEAATALAAAHHSRGDRPASDTHWLNLAEHAYLWLRKRGSLRAVSITLIPGTPRKEGSPVATIFDLSDTDEVSFTLQGFDAKQAEVPAPADTWTWALADPDSSGATLTVSSDTTSATVAGGVPDTNLMLTVAGQNTGLQGAEAIVVQATAAATVGLVAGTPTPEA
jgi:hypothetical protein